MNIIKTSNYISLMGINVTSRMRMSVDHNPISCESPWDTKYIDFFRRSIFAMAFSALLYDLLWPMRFI